MAVGIQPGKADVDNMAGGIARDLDLVMERVGRMAAWLATQSDAQLTALGYSAADITALKNCYTDNQVSLGRLRTIYLGSTALASAQNFKAGVLPLAGILI
jgi:hypothetical protein